MSMNIYRLCTSVLFLCLSIEVTVDICFAQETTTVSIGNECNFEKMHTNSKEELSALTRIQPLIARHYSARYPATQFDQFGYAYEVGICTAVGQQELLPGDDNQHAGVVQIEKDTNKIRVIGSIDKAAIMGGTDWVMLEYKEGGSYHSSCGGEQKRSVIMIICDPNDSEGTLRFIEENNNKTAECYYLFELSHSATCTSQKHPGLGVGSILVIVFLCLVAVYLIGGFVYQRVIVGAKGIEQLPNSAFWRDFGNLTADGCDFVCRSGTRSADDRQYRGIGDEQLTSAQEDDDDIRDDHLLPM